MKWFYNFWVFSTGVGYAIPIAKAPSTIGETHPPTVLQQAPAKPHVHIVNKRKPEGYGDQLVHFHRAGAEKTEKSDAEKTARTETSFKHKAHEKLKDKTDSKTETDAKKQPSALNGQTTTADQGPTLQPAEVDLPSTTESNPVSQLPQPGSCGNLVLPDHLNSNPSMSGSCGGSWSTMANALLGTYSCSFTTVDHQTIYFWDGRGHSTPRARVRHDHF